MNYTEGVIKNTEFFTTAELAKKLKMNVQVITRKVQSGEIRAYKIGKEWRIPEPSVYEWLEANANNPNRSAKSVISYRSRKTASGSTSPQSGPKQQQHLLEYMLAQLEPDRLYREDEIDNMIGRHRDDPGAGRHELITHKMLEKKNGLYRRCAGYKLSN